MTSNDRIPKWLAGLKSLGHILVFGSNSETLRMKAMNHCWTLESHVYAAKVCTVTSTAMYEEHAETIDVALDA